MAHPLHGKKVPGHPNLQYWGANAFIRVRIMVPPELVKTVGKTELVKGLGTQCVSVAVRSSHAVIAEFQAKIDDARPVPSKWARISYEPKSISLVNMSREQVDRVRSIIAREIGADHINPIQRSGFGDHHPRHFGEVPITAPTIDDMPLAGFTWEAAIELWATSKGDAPPTDESVDVYRGHLRRFMAWVGTDNMGDVTEQHIIDYPAVLMAGADGDRKCGNKTINNHMASIRAVFREAMKKKKIIRDPTVDNVHKLKVRKSVMTDRAGFDRDLHGRIITKALTLPHDDPRRWLWLLALVYGGRISEFADATVGAVRMIHGRLCFQVGEEYRNQWNGKPLRLKTDGSPRKLPVHSIFEAWGFLAYVEMIRARGGPTSPLFPSIRVNRYGKRARVASDQCNAWLRDELGIDDPRLVYHSARHTAKTFLRGRVPDQVMDAITGHDDGSVSYHYGETELAVLANAIETYIPIPAAAVAA